jgi:acetyl-CoA acetyltransferase
VEVESGVSDRQADRIVIAGVGMHPWGKWGRSFVEYGVVAARAALADAGLEWADVDFLAAGNTMRNGYPGYVSGSTFAQALGWRGIPVSSSYAACASGLVAVEAARARLRAGMADVALVVGADTAPKGFFGPLPGERPEDPDWLRFHVLGATNPTYFGLYARRRMELYGATTKDFAAVKVKNSRHGLSNPNARYRKEFTEDEIAESPVVAEPLRLVDICATSDGAAALVLTRADLVRDDGRPTVELAAVSTVTPSYPNTYLDMPDIATDSAVGAPATARSFRDSIAHAAYEEAGVGPGDLSCAEVYDLSTALELDWYENIGLCAPGEAEGLLHSGATALGGRVPVNPSGGLACFGEAIPAQAIAQVCELTWQLRGEAGERQVADATVGLSINQGLFGHGSCAIVTR